MSSLVAALAIAVAGCGPSTPNPSPPSSTAQSKTNAAANKAGSIKLDVMTQMGRSSFSTNVKDGRDPFFPDSTRRIQLKPSETAAAAVLAQNQAVAGPLSSHLQLTGLWPGKQRPLAMINKTSIAPGEQLSIPVTILGAAGRPEVRKLTVRCIEIRKNSVVIAVVGEPGNKELPLKTRF